MRSLIAQIVRTTPIFVVMTLATMLSFSSASAESVTSIDSCQVLSQALAKASSGKTYYGGYPMPYTQIKMENASMGIGGGGDSISSTYTRTTGIDEADSMKITKMYLANISQSGSDTNIDIRDHKGGLMNRLDRSFFQVPTDQYYSIQSILATDNRLVVIGDMPTVSDNKDIATKRMMPIFYANKSVVHIYDMSNTKTPKLLKQITLPYYSQQVYLNKDTLLIATNGTNTYQADTGKYPLPRIIETQDGKTKTRVISCGNYQFFSGALESTSLPNLTTILTQDIADTTKPVKDSGFIGSPNSTYFTGDKLFANLMRDRGTQNSCPPGKMCAMIWNPTITNTDIYGFEAKDGIYKLQARASVIGRVGSDYSMNLKDNVLTVISEESNIGGRPAATRLSTYDAKTLKRLGTVSNIAPGETLGGVKFLGDNAYFITYRQTDPVFKVSLTNPAKPKILGALKIPGFSNYLIEYDKNHILAVGMDTKTSTGEWGEFTTNLGIKLDLYNVDGTTPKLISTKTIGQEGSSLGFYDPKGMIWDSSTKMISFPTTLSYTGTERSKNMVGGITLQVSLDKGIVIKNLLRVDTDDNLKTWFDTQCGKDMYPNEDDRPVWCTRDFNADNVRQNRFTSYQYMFSTDRIARSGEQYFLRSYDKLWTFDTSKTSLINSYNAQLVK